MADTKAGETGKTTTSAPPPAATKASEGVTINASELAKLREDAAQGVTAAAEAKKARTELRLMAANTVLDAAKAAGRIVPAEEEYWRKELIEASDERFESVKKYLSGKPTVIKLGAEGRGGAEDATVDDSKRLDAAARKYMSEHANTPYRVALLEVSKEVARA